MWVEDTSTTHTAAYNTITDILWRTNPSEDWDSLAYDATPGVNFWRIYWSPIDGNPCYPSQYGAYFDVQYRVRADQSVNGCGSVNCVYHYTPTWNSGWGHYDYGLSIAFMRTNNLYAHAINHETGHVLGLADPARSGDCPTGGSVMHSRYYGCTTDYSWPTYNDRYNVEYISTYPWP